MKHHTPSKVLATSRLFHFTELRLGLKLSLSTEPGQRGNVVR